MKIALVFDGLGIGGIERVGVDYVNLLLELGHCVDVINLNPKQNDMECKLPSSCRIYHARFPRSFAPEYYAKAVKMAWWGRFGYPLVFTFLKILICIYKIFRPVKEEYDVTIAFSGHFNDLTYVAENLICTNKKACWLHGALVDYALISDGFINLYKKIKNLVVLSEEMQEQVFLSNRNIGLGFNMHHIYNPIFINRSVVDAQKIRLLKNKYNRFALMVARFAHPKDQKTVIDAINILNNKYQFEYKVVFVGDGPDYESMKNYANRMCALDKYVFFEGARMDVQNYYASANLFLFASLQEGLPTVILEAMAFGLPVIATDCEEGPREILKDNQYGILTKVQDADEMAERIAYILNNQKLYKHYQLKGEERLRDFLPETIKKQLELFLENIE